MADARKATQADGPRMASTLASAFAVDPVSRWMCGEEDTERRLGPFWRTVVKAGLAHADHECYLTTEGAGVAMWRGIDKWKVPLTELVRTAPGMVRSLRLRTLATMGLLTAMEKVHPTGPHYYLEFLGTRSDLQGKGIGSAVINPMLERCDQEGVPAYLESSNRQNVPFYARHGFVETGIINAPKGGPSLTAMWREPRSA